MVSVPPNAVTKLLSDSPMSDRCQLSGPEYQPMPASGSSSSSVAAISSAHFSVSPSTAAYGRHAAASAVPGPAIPGAVGAAAVLRRSGAVQRVPVTASPGRPVRLIVLTFVAADVHRVSVAVLGSLLGKSDDNTAQPRVTGPSIVPTPTSNPQKGTAEDYLLNADIYRTGRWPTELPGREPGRRQPGGAEGVLPEALQVPERCVAADLQGARPGQAGPGSGRVRQAGDDTMRPLPAAVRRVLAFDCYGNQVMYTDVKQMNRAFGPQQDLAYLMTIAHEYGHHVQGVSGLFYARAVYLQDHPDQQLESSRRNELQASCFGGVFSKAVEKSYPLTNRLGEFKEQSSNSFGETP